MDYVLREVEPHGGLTAWIVDDTGIPKKGDASVGVARKYCAVLRKTENCQVAVSASIAQGALSLPAVYRFYLPESWANDPARCRAADVPASVKFQKKWEIALDRMQ